MKTNGMLLIVLIVFGAIPLLVGKLFFIVDFTGIKAADLVAYLFIIALIYLPFYVVLVEMQDKTLKEFLKGIKRLLIGDPVPPKTLGNNMFSEVYTVIADCQQKVAAKEQALEEALELEKIFWSFGTDKFFSVNVTDDKFIYGLDKWEQRQLDTDSYTAQMEFIANKLLDPYYLKDFLRLFNKENLIKLDKSGRNQLLFDCKMKNKDNKFVWIRILGSLELNYKKIKLIANFCFREIDQQKKLEKELLAQEQLDISTGFYSRMSGKKIIESFLDEEGIFSEHALINLNLTGFQKIVDGFGEVTFEHYLQKVADKILAGYRESSLIFRNSENQIIILLKDFEDEQDLDKKINQIVGFCRENLRMCETELSLAPKAGVAVYPRNGKSYQQLFALSNRALLYLDQAGEGADYIIYSVEFEKVL